MRSKQQITINISLLAVLALFGLASQAPWLSMWGLNHLNFLPQVATYIYWAVTALVVVLILMPSKATTGEDKTGVAARILFGDQPWGRMATAIAVMVLFYLARAETALAGDGYAWLDNFGRGEGYIHKWTEPGSIYLVRGLQALQGEYTRESARLAFRVLSILSGGVFVYFAISLAKSICREGMTRWLTLTTLLLSGAMLFFFGVPEFYGMSWATATVFLYFSIRFAEGQSRWWLVLLVYLLAALMHLQVLYFLPGLLYLFIRKSDNQVFRRIGYTALGVAVVVGLALLVWLYQTRIDIEILILPLFTSRANAPDYTVFSLHHARDLLNLVFLVFPGLVAIVAWWLFSRGRTWAQRVPSYLAALSAGSLAFVLFYGAAITMGRDWDIMSLGLLAPALLMLYQIDRGEVKISGRTVIIYALVAAVMTGSCVAASTGIDSAEKRAYSLLNNNNRNAWLIYARYLRMKGDKAGYQRIINETHMRYPDYSIFRSLGQMEQEGKSREVFEYAAAIVKRNPYEPDYQRYYAGMCVQFGRYSEAEEHYKKALWLQPYDAGLKQEVAHFLNGRGRYEEALPLLLEAHELLPANLLYMESLALTHIYLEQFLKAAEIGREMLSQDEASAGGHLVSMLAALGVQDHQKARYHYQQYLKYGINRPGYESIKESYKMLGD